MVEREFNRFTPGTAPTYSVGVVRRLLLKTFFIFSALFVIRAAPCHAQWTPLLTWYRFYDVYFIDLPGPPRIGFVLSGIAEGYDTGFFKTTDGGQTWRKINVPLYSNVGLQFCDIVFKDSLTGWMSVAGSDFYGGCVKTTDGGETWSSILSGSTSDAMAIYYNKTSGGLFLSTYGALNGGWNLVSWDEGATWSNQTFTGALGYSGIAFVSEDSGVMADNDIWLPAWFRTTDGGNTWNTIAMDSDVWQPLAIRGTQTYFASTFGGNTYGAMILRTDDSWNTWKVIYQFPWQPFPYDGFGVQSPACIRGDSNNLIVQNCGSFYRSTDQGISWQSLCGPGWADTYKRFYVRGNLIYCTTDDSVGGSTLGTVWMLNLDSLYTFPTGISFPGGLKSEIVNGSSKVTVNFSLEDSESIGIDSGDFAFHYDTSLLSLNSITLPSSWVIVDSSSAPGILILKITADSSQPLPNPILTLSFTPYLTLTASHAKVYLDSANLYGHRLNCDCAVESIDGEDSVQINFTGCGDSLILAAMNDSLPFYIESIQPNPAQDEIMVSVTASSATPVNYVLYNAVGFVRASGTLSSRKTTLDVSNVPSGIYYLRFSSEEFVQIRAVGILR